MAGLPWHHGRVNANVSRYNLDYHGQIINQIFNVNLSLSSPLQLFPIYLRRSLQETNFTKTLKNIEIQKFYIYDKVTRNLYIKLTLKNRKLKSWFTAAKRSQKVSPLTDNFVLNINFLYATAAALRKKLSIILVANYFSM